MAQSLLIIFAAPVISTTYYMLNNETDGILLGTNYSYRVRMPKVLANLRQRLPARLPGCGSLWASTVARLDRLSFTHWLKDAAVWP